MLFNSFAFALFLPTVFLLYWSLNRHLKVQNTLLVIASYFFYGWWDWRFLSLLFISSMTDYLIGLQLSHAVKPRMRKVLLAASIAVNIGILGYFKYFNFFVDSFIETFSFIGIQLHYSTLKIILPIGISFYTFQTLSYTIDVFRRKMEPTRDIIAFLAYVSFFPQLVAGPIERAAHLLPQFKVQRHFDYAMAVDGMKQILWGFFKKMVIADNCAYYANEIFNHSGNYPGSSLLIGVLFFTFQIYGDFSGYSDIAIGTARLFGFNLMKNFAFPYFSRDIAEFWRRWHISLTTWFRDYLYIPLGGSHGGNWMKTRNIFIIFLVSGFWHGANWTFIIWGFLNALYFLPLMLLKKNRKNIEIVAKDKLFPSLKELLSMGTTFGMTVFAWIFFRAATVKDAFGFIRGIFSRSLISFPKIPGDAKIIPLTLLIILFFIVEWLGRENEYALEKIGVRWAKPMRWALYYSLFVVIFLFAGKEQQFIYFQF